MAGRNKTRQNNAGFTLIEALIVMALMAVLVTLAVPTYNFAIAKSERAEAYADLNKIAQAQERHFTAYRSYTNDFGRLGLGAGNTIQSSRGTSQYQIPIIGTIDPACVPNPANAETPASGCTSYTITASPTGNANNTLQVALDNAGVKRRAAADAAINNANAWTPGWPE